MVKRTLHGSKLKKFRVSGFQKRMSNKYGINVIKARRKKKRKFLTAN